MDVNLAVLLLGMVALGFRHGFDWDHIAAITDITTSQEDRRDAIVFGTIYARNLDKAIPNLQAELRA